MVRICCNPAHPKESPVTASHVLESHTGQPHFLCGSCATILDHLGETANFIEPIEEWEEARLTVAEMLTRQAEEYGDLLYDQSIAS